MGISLIRDYNTFTVQHSIWLSINIMLREPVKHQKLSPRAERTIHNHIVYLVFHAYEKIMFITKTLRVFVVASISFSNGFRSGFGGQVCQRTRYRWRDRRRGGQMGTNWSVAILICRVRQAEVITLLILKPRKLWLMQAKVTPQHNTCSQSKNELSRLS